MKLLIIDDEAGTREVIKIIVNLNMIGFDEILEADNARIGLDLINKNKPDVIITDMKMPEMDGVSLLETLEDSDEKFRIIVISGFADYEYTRAAIKTKVIDYLLKPIKREELILSLKKAIKDIKDASIPKLEKNELKLISDYFFDNIKNENMLSKDVIESYLVNLDTMECNDSFSLSIVKIINLDEIKNASFNGYQELLFYNIEESLRKIISPNIILVPFEDQKELLILRQIAHVDFNSYKLDFLNTMKEFVHLLNTTLGMECIAILYSGIIKREYILNAYRRLKQTLRNLNLLDSKRVFVQDKGHFEKKIGQYSFSRKSDDFKDALEKCDEERSKNIITDVFDEIYQNDIVSINDLNILSIEFLNIISNCISNLGLNINELYEKIGRHTEFLKHSGSLNEIMNWMIKCVEYSIQYISRAKKESCSKVLRDIIKYMDAYYYETIDLDLLSKKFFLSKGHISRLFKNELNENFVEYKTKIRLCKAAELLKEKEQTLQYISELVGFSDVSYFSKSFKKQFGISPEEYRNAK